MLYHDLPPEFWIARSSEWTSAIREEALGQEQALTSSTESSAHRGVINFIVIGSLLLFSVATIAVLAWGSLKVTESAIQLTNPLPEQAKLQ